jgi:hypothetical protein
MKKRRVRAVKEKEFVKCHICGKLLPLRVSTIRIPKHRDPYNVSSLCPGSGKPLDYGAIVRVRRVV